ncbi:glycosyltransferase [Ruegeria sp. HKCCD7255]|uniref:glycosyltransferase n=1 Tax=Ruegeria sp. HKCCD7255 TaxID=2683004 RepID=UPI001489C0BB|nr:glycosyltransferase [Ruegeria sp. HKCCD7255]
MKISVVTIVLNPDSDFARTAESVLAQNYTEVEWVVLDGSSWSDPGRQYLNRYKEAFDYYASCPDEGVYAAMNTACEKATGEYVVFLNSGDIFFKQGTLTEVSQFLQREPDILYGDHDYVSGGAHHFRRASGMDQLAKRLSDGNLEGGWHGRFPCHQATFYKRELLAKEPFDTQLRIVADHDLLLRAHAKGYQIQHAELFVCRYYGGGFSAQNATRCVAEWADVYSRYSNHPEKVIERFYGQEFVKRYVRREKIRTEKPIETKDSNASTDSDEITFDEKFRSIAPRWLKKEGRFEKLLEDERSLLQLAIRYPHKLPRLIYIGRIRRRMKRDRSK